MNPIVIIIAEVSVIIHDASPKKTPTNKLKNDGVSCLMANFVNLFILFRNICLKKNKITQKTEL